MGSEDPSREPHTNEAYPMLTMNINLEWCSSRFLPGQGHTIISHPISNPEDVEMV